jgi:hypothetical protein
MRTARTNSEDSGVSDAGWVGNLLFDELDPAGEDGGEPGLSIKPG